MFIVSNKECMDIIHASSEELLEWAFQEDNLEQEPVGNGVPRIGLDDLEIQYPEQ